MLSTRDTGIRAVRKGASVQSWRASTPRAVLEHLVEVYGLETAPVLLRKFEEHVRANDSLLSTIVEYWFTNNLNSLIAAQQRATPQHAAQVAAIREKATRDVRETVTKGGRNPRTSNAARPQDAERQAAAGLHGRGMPYPQQHSGPVARGNRQGGSGKAEGGRGADRGSSVRAV
jgi:hypothetical protein